MTPKGVMTEKQQLIYEFIKDKILTRGYGPTVREIGDQFQIRSPNGVMCHLKALERKGIITREQKRSRAIELSEPLSRQSIPLKGKIAAGSPLMAVEQTESVDFAPFFDEDHFCLQVTGLSMIEAQIADGDFVVVRKQKTCKDGEIVVALIDGEEATLKRCFKENNRVRLEPANSSMKPIYASNVEILGVVEGVIRQY
jgi:repressor LexA